MRKLTKVTELTTPCKLFNIIGYEEKNGVRDPIYQEVINSLFKASVKSFGGTEVVVNGKISYVDTIEVKCNYRPDILLNSRIELVRTGKVYEIISEPDNVDQRNIELFFKCEAVKK